MNNSFFSADYRDGRVYFGGKNYPEGIFAVHLLNQFYIKDTAARIAVFCDSVCFHVLDQLQAGYLIVDDLVGAGKNTLEQIKTLPDLKPFSVIDINALKRKVTSLFTEQTGERICDYFRERGKIGQLDQNELAVRSLYSSPDSFPEEETLIAEVSDILSFFDNLSEDMINAHRKLCEFVSRIPEAERYDEKHLLPLALEIFGPAPFPVTTEYIATNKNKSSNGETVARRMYFDRYYSFIITDFFEGLHHGHYPQRCGICGKHFLMQSARKQKYCTFGIAPEQYKGKPITCRKYAAVIHRKERAEADPITDLYNRRCASIRSEKSLRIITEEFAKAAKALALDRKLRAHNDDEYAKSLYALDLARKKLYADTKKQIE